MMIVETLIAVFVVCVYLFIRNIWVYKARIWIIENDFKYYDAYPTQAEMLLKYPFVWSLSRFKMNYTRIYPKHNPRIKE